MSLPPPDYSRSDTDEHKHQRILLSAMQVARPVQVAGKAGFLHALSVQMAGGKVEMTAYLAGDAKPVDAAEVQLQDLPT